MRKSIVVLLCAGYVNAANAQKGSVLLFGGLNGSTLITTGQNAPTETRTGFGITPGLGYQVSDKWTVGLAASFNYYGSHTAGLMPDNHPHTIGGGGGLFARYTLPITDLLFFYTQAEGIYTTSRAFDNGAIIPGSASNTFSLKISPNIGINIKNGYALNFGFGNFGYRYTRTPGADFSTSSINYNFAQGFTIGISKKFIRHTKATSGKAE